MEQIKELCEFNSLHYHIDSNPDINRVLIDDEFWFYINNMDDINNFKTYIDIIKGRNEMVNTICEKLNTTIEKGCNLKLFEYHQKEMVCISNNSITININNERFINITLFILLRPLEYYLISKDDKHSYKLKSTIAISNVLDQLCNYEKMTTYTEQIKELCDLNSIEYEELDEKIFININDDDIFFDKNDKLIYQKILSYIDIIKGRNEMVNTICDKLNTTIEKGCRMCKNDDDEWNRNFICKKNSNSSILLNIHNIHKIDKENIYNITYTSYEKYINCKILITITDPLEYYLIDKEEYYKLKSTIDLENVLDQLYTYDKRKCSKDLCDGIVNMKKDFPNPYGLCKDKSEYMLSTAHGYRNKSSSFSKYYFCSKECMDYFDKYTRCHRCHEDGKGTYIEELGYTLCNGRSDHNPSCIVKYEIEKRYLSEDRNKQLYKIVINYFGDNCKDSNFSLSSDFEELFELIKKNDFRVSYDILTDICYARDTYSLRDISSNDKEVITVCSECGCTKHSKVNYDDKDECYKCNKKLWTEFYYNNDTNTEINGLVCHTCCDKNNDYILLKK